MFKFFLDIVNSVTWGVRMLCKNNDNNFSIRVEVILRNIGNLRIKEALSIAKLHPQINSSLELNTEYIIN